MSDQLFTSLWKLPSGSIVKVTRELRERLDNGEYAAIPLIGVMLWLTGFMGGAPHRMVNFNRETRVMTIEPVPEQANNQQGGDMPSMTLEQASAEKVEAEAQIRKIVHDFQKRTGVLLRGCDMNFVDYLDVESIPRSLITTVTLRTDL